jgi:glycogen phosphorylase
VALIGYFSMEIGLSAAMPTYAGGLGVLAGDSLKAAADLSLPMVGVTLAHRHGYFFQRLDAEGNQREEPVSWRIDDFATLHNARVHVEIEGRTVHLQIWRYEVVGATGHRVPVLLLDSSAEENGEFDRTLTDNLYGGDHYMRVCQEVILGIGGVRALRATGFEGVNRFHLNEGHAAFISLALLDEAPSGSSFREKLHSVRERCVFTTHTPVPAGHDRFALDLIERVLGDRYRQVVHMCASDGCLNMTLVALTFSRYVNGVTIRHSRVSRSMFPEHQIHAITNGVHAPSWTTAPFAALFDRHLPEWRKDTVWLRNALALPPQEIREAHESAKVALVEMVNRMTNLGFDKDVCTLGFGRRSTAYKRPLLLLSDLDRVIRIAEKAGPIQIIFAGKAHPHDYAGKDLIREIVRRCGSHRDLVKVAFLQNYDMDIGKVLCGGVDVWVNTPRPPWEASGTSGMKSALNGVPSLSVLDGWWIEGCIEGITGWGIGQASDTQPLDDAASDYAHANELYEKLEHRVLPLYYSRGDDLVSMMRFCIALNGSFFNTHRMMLQYVQDAYRLW